MKIIYGFTNCSDKTYKKLFDGKPFAVLQPDQKYHGLLIRGLCQNGAEVRCFSGLPINRRAVKDIFVHFPNETEDGAFYHYYSTLNLPLFRHLCIFCGALKAVLQTKSLKKDTFVLCDCLNIANALGMVIGAKLKRIPITMIVTDLPDFMYGGMTLRLAKWVLSHADGYVYLTEQMNARLNVRHKPYIVLEGHCDTRLSAVDESERFENRIGKKVVVYAGSLLRLYGVDRLTEGFLKANVPDSELHIFGDGDYRDELTAIAAKDSRVVYCGVRPNADVVYAEQRASLLVNPRPVSPEYTKYSFPSKNMEYMASGTPVLTTALPGMPAEYRDYVYLFNDDSVEGIAKKLREVLCLPLAERTEKGNRAGVFVRTQKSAKIQAGKVIALMNH